MTDRAKLLYRVFHPHKDDLTSLVKWLSDHNYVESSCALELLIEQDIPQEEFWPWDIDGAKARAEIIYGQIENKDIPDMVTWIFERDFAWIGEYLSDIYNSPEEE